MGQMNIATAIMVYLFLWWGLFFMFLPFGVRHEEKAEGGNDPGAPDRPLLWKKAGAASIGAGLLFLVWWYLLDTGLFSLVS
ncbi:DUF1467 family protein [Aestuariispira insulae]|uniref:Putative secreted protein n=1 Tax=Aestuariispira insulae TaxID=1461337 RepID=A0A3D9HUZ6_9PROT|nr:DUF1467 family protein [Aestuariispira insulae]RED53312.1 putative secreted protein [Aestuariispira insulae]